MERGTLEIKHAKEILPHSLLIRCCHDLVDHENAKFFQDRGMGKHAIPPFPLPLSQMSVSDGPCRKGQLLPEKEECPDSVRLWG